MPTFASFDGLKLHYEDRGDGPPTLLLHGFAANSILNWEQPGVMGALLDAGRRVIALDARGHGLSEKPYNPAAYANDAMAVDVSALADEIEVDLFDVVGYSMGARTAMAVTSRDPRVRAGVFGGVGAAFAQRPVSFRTSVAEALERGESDDPLARDFRRFAEATGADLKALAAIQRGGSSLASVDLSAIKVPVLFVTGTGDDLVGDPQPLANRVLNAQVVRCPGDHLSAVNTPEFIQAVVDFLRDQD